MSGYVCLTPELSNGKGVGMLLAAKHGKDRNLKLCEDEITSCVFGPLAFMPVQEVWRLFRKWLPFSPELWPKETPSDLSISFWENLKKSGRVEPDIIFRFAGVGEPLLTVMFEVKWGIKGEPRLSHDPQLVNQWAALSGKERERALHVYLVKEVGNEKEEVGKSFSKKTSFPKKEWQERLVCLGWRGLIDVLRFERPKFTPAMNLWADSVLSFLGRRGLTTFTGFDWLTEVVKEPGERIFWKPITPNSLA